MKVKKPIEYETTCTFCGAVIRFELNEIAESSYGGRHILCPHCGAKLQTHYNNWNEPVLNINIKPIYANDSWKEITEDD